LLDLDGVLCNFTDGADEVHGRPLDWTQWYGGFKTAEEFWAPINKEGAAFWLNLKPYPWLREVVSFSMAHFNQVYICTSPAHEPCSTAKVMWIERYIPELKRDFVITSHKHLLANPHTVLVDDSNFNVDNFCTADGFYILFPQPWNRNEDAAHMRVEYTQRLLETISRLKVKP
jgi:5'(3')-deoxyribonucleotidase